MTVDLPIFFYFFQSSEAGFFDISDFQNISAMVLLAVIIYSVINFVFRHWWPNYVGWKSEIVATEREETLKKIDVERELKLKQLELEHQERSEIGTQIDALSKQIIGLQTSVGNFQALLNDFLVNYLSDLLEERRTTMKMLSDTGVFKTGPASKTPPEPENR